MSDTALNKFIGYGTNAQRLAFTPSPATIAAAPFQLYLWYTTDTVKLWGYDTSWHDLSAAGSGNVSAAGTLTNNALVIGQGTTAVATTTTGTGILTALGINTGSAGAPVLLNGAGGTPSSLTGTNITGLPLTTGVTGVLPGANGGGLVELAQIITAASQATIDFTSISGAYNSLRLVYDARDTGAGTSNLSVFLRLNNDTTAGNYTTAARAGSVNGVALVSTVAASGSGGGFIGGQPADGNTAGIVAGGSVLIPNYARTTFHKRVVAQNGFDDGTNGQIVQQAEFRWASTAAITRVTIFTAGTAFKDGLAWTLYGMN